MNKTVISENTRSIIYNNSNGMLSGVLTDIQSQILNNTFVAEGKFNIRNSNFWKDFIIEDSGNFKIKEDNNPRFNEFLISGRFSDDVKYILFDDKDILNNSKKLFKEIRENKTYREKIIDQTTKTDPPKSNFGESKSGVKFYLNKYVNNNLNTYNSYNVWDKNIGSTILGAKSNRIENNLKGVPLSNFNPTGNTKNSKYINVSNFVSNSGCTFGDTLLETNLYKQNDKYARALMMLSTFPFRTFKEAFMDSVFPNGELSGARIVNLPNLYVYYLGGLLKRYDGEININFNVNSISGNCTYSEFETDKKQYLNIGYLRGLSGDTKIDLEQELVKLPKSVRKDLKFQFENWVDGDRFNDTLNGFFELNVNYMVPSINETTITPQNKKSGENYILGQLQKTTNMTILNPKIFDPNRDNKLLVIDAELSQYIDSLIEKFKAVEVENNKIPELTSSEDIKDATQEKLQIYNYFKNINLKWVGGDKKSFNICGGGKNALIDYFKFIDRGWRNIGSEATFNLKSFLTLGSNLNTSVYFFMSKLLRDSNFLFQILPTYINYKDASEVSKIFQPLTQLESNSESGPIFCCIYVGGASEVLDISERSNYYFKNDGYRFPNPNDPNDQGDLPPDMVSPDDSSLVAFRVAFGAQNQTVFKNVSLSQQEHKETGEYFRALTDLVDKRGGTQQTYVGTDLLRLFKTRSYTCKVDALGCMNIQPLMYFDLQNVPFFNGAYLITSVNHSISPNHMTTNFQGVRQSKFISPPTDKIVAELNLDLNESSEIPKIEFTNLDNKNPLYTIGVLNPTEPFDFDTNFTLEKFKLLGVNLPDEVLQNKINIFETILTSNSATTNSQVTTFMAAVLSNSNNLTNDEMSWEVENIENFKVTDSNNNNLFYGGVAGTVLVDNDPIIAEQSDSYLSSVPFFTAGTPEQRAYTPAGNEDLNEYLKNESIEIQKEDIKKKIGNTTDEKRKEELEIELKNLKEKEKNLIKTLPYYNIFKGDAWRFRPRGYLYIIGRKQYNDIGKLGSLGQLIDNPSLAKQFPEIISIDVWAKYKKGEKGQTAYELSNIGTASSYARCIEICHQYKGPGLETAFNTFENVLTVFEDSNGESLIDFNNP